MRNTNKLLLLIKIIKFRAEQMAHQLGALVAIPEDLVLVTSPTWWLTTVYNSSFRGYPGSLLASTIPSTHVEHTHIHTHSHEWTKKPIYIIK